MTSCIDPILVFLSIKLGLKLMRITPLYKYLILIAIYFVPLQGV